MEETYVLHITKECNLNCTYCYEKDKTSTYTWDEIRILLDNITLHNKDFTLEFLGGEPCLRIDLIEMVVKYLNGMDGLNVGYVITTNGTIINDKLIQLLQNNPYALHWAASIDGHQFGNFMRVDKQGKNSYDRVIQNFHTLYNELNGDRYQQLSCHLVSHPYNIGYLYEGIVNLYHQGFRRFGIGTIESTIIIDEMYCNEFILQLKTLSDTIHNSDLLEGISIDLFNYVKPRSDRRFYIKDKTGKTILETYGRVDNDIKDTPQYKADPSTSNISDMICDIREAVYNYHNRK